MTRPSVRAGGIGRPVNSAAQPGTQPVEQQDHHRDRDEARDDREAQNRQDGEADQAERRLEPDARRQPGDELEEARPFAVHGCAHFFSKSQTSWKPISSCMPRYCGTFMPLLVPCSLRCSQACRIASAATLKPSPG